MKSLCVFFTFIFCFSFQTFGSIKTERGFEKVLFEVESKLKVFVAKNYQSRLEIQHDWDREIGAGGGASAGSFAKNWKVAITGGLARDPLINRDALDFVVCHELGHSVHSLSFEPGADYYAARICLKELWKNNRWVRKRRVCKNSSLGENFCSRVLNAFTRIDKYRFKFLRKQGMIESRIQKESLCRNKVVLQGALGKDFKSCQDSFLGSVSFGFCSGVLARFHNQPLNTPAYLITAGHCAKKLKPAEKLINSPSKRSYFLLDKNGEKRGKQRSVKKLIFASMTQTDLAIYETSKTIKELIAEGIRPHRIAKKLDSYFNLKPWGWYYIVSGKHQKNLWCRFERKVPILFEDEWKFENFLSFQGEACSLVPGDSGAPIFSNAKNELIGIASTTNNGGEACSLNNPCEEKGVQLRAGGAYIAPLVELYDCLDSNNRFDLSNKRCPFL